jgi:hypothetical protein
MAGRKCPGRSRRDFSTSGVDVERPKTKESENERNLDAFAALFDGGIDVSTGFCHASPHVIVASNRFRNNFGPCVPVQGEKRFLINCHTQGA